MVVSGATTVSIQIGTSDDLQDDKAFPNRLSSMINKSYGHQRVDPVDMFKRLSGAGQPPLAKELPHLANGNEAEIGRTNRVLHLAYRDGELVGACSSTVQPAWTPTNCGHWGMLAVAPAAQGSGVASALVAAAERRLVVCGCSMVQVEPAAA